jgi:O-antigen/teichoic acid export membrane protein
LAKKEIRLQYSGFIIFAAKMLSVATGLAFQFMIARTATESEYGIWFNIKDILAYFTLLATALPFWTMRFVARDKEGAAKTGILANLTISVIATVIYLPLVPLITSSLGVGQEYFLLYLVVAAQIIELYSLNALEACLRARMPQAIGYGLLVAEACKVILGYILIIRFQQPLLGALLSLIVAFTIQIAYYFKLLLEELKQRAKWHYVKEWLKGSVANIYNIVGSQIAAFIFIMLFIYGGREARSNYGVAAQIASVITYTSFLAFALYPKLLAEKSSEDITTSLKMVLMFAIPMTAGAIMFADSYMTIMDIVYKDAWPVLVMLAVNSFVATMSTFFSSVLFGVERVDEKAKISFSELIKSRLFIVLSLPYFHSAITLPTAFYILVNYAQNQPLQAALYVSAINSLAHFTMFIVLYAIVRKMVKIDIPWKKIAKYVFASAVMATVLFVIPHPTRIILTLILTAIGGIIYLALLIVIDKEARLLVHSMWQEIKFKVKGIIT